GDRGRCGVLVRMRGLVGAELFDQFLRIGFADRGAHLGLARGVKFLKSQRAPDGSAATIVGRREGGARFGLLHHRSRFGLVRGVVRGERVLGFGGHRRRVFGGRGDLGGLFGGGRDGARRGSD